MAEESVRGPRRRLSERVSAASYGTVLVMAALAAIDADGVESGLGWEIVTGVGVATWVAHLYAEVVGDRLRYDTPLDRREIHTAAIDGLPIIVAAVLPAVVLLLGRLDVLDDRVALWIAAAVALGQLVGLGGFVGYTVSPAAMWSYAAVTGAIGVAVVTLKLVLGH